MTDLSKGAPDRLLTERATAEILNISCDTLRRLSRRGEGPARRKISPRRVGYKLSEVEAYRDGRSLPAPPSTSHHVSESRGDEHGAKGSVPCRLKY